MAFTTVTVVGTIQDAQGDPAANAAINFVLSESILDTQSGITVIPSPIIARTNATGSFSVNLFATDDTTTEPQGQVYKCTINVPGGSISGLYGGGSYFPMFYFALPHAATPQINLVQLISQFTMPTYVGPGFQPGYYDQTSNLVETLPRKLAKDSVGLTSGSLYMSYFTPAWTLSTTSVSLNVLSAAGSTSSALVGLYQVNSNSNSTLLASTANNVIHFNITSITTASLSSTQILTAGQRYALGVLWIGSGSPQVMAENVLLANLSPIISGAVGSQVVLPSAVSLSNVSANSASVWARLF